MLKNLLSHDTREIEIFTKTNCYSSSVADDERSEQVQTNIENPTTDQQWRLKTDEISSIPSFETGTSQRIVVFSELEKLLQPLACKVKASENKSSLGKLVNGREGFVALQNYACRSFQVFRATLSSYKSSEVNTEWRETNTSHL